MSVASPALPAQAAAVPRARSRGQGRLALLFAVIVATSTSAFALSLVSFLKPIGSGGDALPGYAAIAPHRDYVWAFFLIAGVQLVVGATAAALATVLLAPERGSRWAAVGGSLVWLGAAVYGVGIGGWAAAYYAAADAATLGRAGADRLVDHVNDTVRLFAVPIGGAVLVALGTVLLGVALWRARTVPRWLPVLGIVTAVLGLVAPPDQIIGLLGEAASSVTTIAVGWYAWQRC